jgi:predicted transcriptional regulator/predicted nucleotidyltransferase
MRIKRNEKIANIPIIKIRDYFKEIREVEIIKAELGRYFNLNTKNINLLINELLHNELIEKTQKNEYQLTMKGQALCAARSVSPMSKEKADKIFKDFMHRVDKVNNNNYYLCKVEKLLLFGSYLNPDKDDYGDIDIAFELKRKIDNFDEYEKARKKRIKEMKEKGKYFPCFMDEMFFPEKEVMLKLKNKCQYISLHRTEDEILKYSKYKQIYPVQNRTTI